MTHNQIQAYANKIAESVAWENKRHNVQVENLNDWKNREDQRHNIATETEAHRHQFRMEELEDFKNGVLNYQAVEQTRHNIALEDIQRNNVEVEKLKAAENARHNQESERINAWLASNESFRNAETALHNRNMENIDRNKVAVDMAYKAAAGSNQAAQASKNKADAKYLNATHKARVSKTRADTIITYENVVLNPISQGAKAFGDMAKGVGRAALNLVN